MKKKEEKKKKTQPTKRDLPPSPPRDFECKTCLMASKCEFYGNSPTLIDSCISFTSGVVSFETIESYCRLDKIVMEPPTQHGLVIVHQITGVLETPHPRRAELIPTSVLYQRKAFVVSRKALEDYQKLKKKGKTR